MILLKKIVILTCSLLALLAPEISFAAVPLGQGLSVIQQAPQINLLSPSDFSNSGTNCNWGVEWQTSTQRATGQSCTQTQDWNKTTNYGNKDWSQVNSWWQNVSVETAGPCGWSACPRTTYMRCGRLGCHYWNPNAWRK